MNSLFMKLIRDLMNFRAKKILFRLLESASDLEGVGVNVMRISAPAPKKCVILID